MENYIPFIKHLTETSSKILLKFYRQDLSVDIKDDQSPVTIADKSAEEAMREIIMKHYPNHGILGEELGHYQAEAAYQWTLDPIDGTRSFISGVPLFGTLIALLHNNQPIIGALKLPVFNELLIGDHKQTTLNGINVEIRSCQRLSEAVLLTTDHLDIEKYQNIQKFDRLIRKVKIYRTWGDCFGYYLVACGQADIMIDAMMRPWDLMALIPIIRGAGGLITDYQGKDPITGSSIIAANPRLHPLVVSSLNQDVI